MFFSLSWAPFVNAEVKGWKFHERVMRKDGTLHQPEIEDSSSEAEEDDSVSQIYHTGTRCNPFDLIWPFGEDGQTIMATWSAIKYALEHGRRVSDPTKKFSEDSTTQIRVFLGGTNVNFHISSCFYYGSCSMILLTLFHLNPHALRH